MVKHQTIKGKYARVCEAQELASRRAQANPQEFYIVGETRKERKRFDPRYNETAGTRAVADKDVVFAARKAVALFQEEKDA